MLKQFINLTIALGFCVSNCQGQENTHKMKKENQSNPLLCDPQTGVCEIPGTAGQEIMHDHKAIEKPVRITYFTDPICSSCWGIEPQLKKLKLEYGSNFEIEYRMGGLLPSWDVYNSGGIGKPSDVAHHWDEVSAHYEMPIDGDVWIEDPLPSSYPPSVAFKAAEMQDKQKALRFMRRIREMVFLEKKNITKWEHLAQAAVESGLDTAKLHTDFEGKAQQLFQEDLDFSRQSGVRGFPTMFFTDSLSNRITVYGVKPYQQFEQALLQLYPQSVKKQYDNSPGFLFSHFGTLTTKEFAVLTGVTFDEANVKLKDLAAKKVITRQDSKNGPLWKYVSQ